MATVPICHLDFCFVIAFAFLAGFSRALTPFTFLKLFDKAHACSKTIKLLSEMNKGSEEAADLIVQCSEMLAGYQTKTGDTFNSVLGNHK